MSNETALSTGLDTMAGMEAMAQHIAKSGMFGITNPSQAICLMMLCKSEGIDPILALRRYHLIEGKPSMRADAMAGEFEAHGGLILWHVRNDAAAAATFFSDRKKVDDKAIERAKARFTALDGEDWDAAAALAYPGEDTIIRTFADAVEKKLAMSWKKGENGAKGEWVIKHNWMQSKRQMLTARCVTEGVRLMAPGLIAGIYTPDELEDAKGATQHDAEEGDANAIRAMLAGYMERAENATPHERKRLYGLASDLKVKLQEMGEEAPADSQPDAGMTQVECHPIPPVETTEKPKSDPAPGQTEPRVIHAETEVMPKEPTGPAWESVRWPYGGASSKMLQKTMKELLLDTAQKQADIYAEHMRTKFLAAVEERQEKGESITENDVKLYAAVKEAVDHYQARREEIAGKTQLELK